MESSLGVARTDRTRDAKVIIAVMVMELRKDFFTEMVMIRHGHGLGMGAYQGCLAGVPGHGGGRTEADNGP